ncbi:MAG: hypothetical protein ABJF11_18940 [Reichenbachiella sp.]|uniref:hypothetical protein n=1 Tax=Reichenbachiella sp. TaxID=2184521 RepID=UPI003267AFE1
MRIGFLILAGLFIGACSSNEEVNCEVSDLKLTVSGNVNADCNEGASIELDATGGEGPYLYSFDGSPEQDLTTFNGMPLGGPFLAKVQDVNGCEATLDVEITGDENTVTFEAQSTDAGCGSSQGTITVEASGGEGAYSYKIEDETFGDVSSFNQLEAGTYRVSVKDGTGCINVQGIQVLSGISYESEVKSIVIGSCATTDCHVSGTGRVDLSIFSNVQANAASIRTRVSNKSMPKDDELTNEEIETILCWIDDGALNN